MKRGLWNSFSALPWDRILGAAPAVVEGARGLLQRVAGDAGRPAAAPEPPPGLNPDVMAAIDVRIRPLADRISALDQESRASFDVVRAMAEQHAQVVEAVDVLLARTLLLRRLVAALGAALVALAVLVALRW